MLNFIKRLKPRHYFFGLFLVSAISYLLGVRHVGFAIWGDTHYYYAYTRSIILDRDINFTNEATHPLYPFPNGLQLVPATGHAVSNFSPGPGLLWLPGFILGQAIVVLLTQFGLPVATDGYSLVNQLIVGLSAVSMSLFGLYLIFLNLEFFFRRSVALIASFILLLTTQLLYYTTLDPLNSHSAELLFTSLSLYLALKLRLVAKNSYKLLILLGVSLGLASIIRNQDLLISCFVVVFVMLNDILPLDHFWFGLKKLIILTVPFGLITSIQLWFTWIIYHQFGSPYLINGAKFSWLQPDFMSALFSQGNGFFFFAPIGLVALVGLVGFYYDADVFSVKKSLVKLLAILSLLVFISQLYIIASWPAEIIGGPYGSRMFIGTLPFLAFGLAWLVDRFSVKPKLSQSLACLVVVLLFGWNVYQTYLMLAHW